MSLFERVATLPLRSLLVAVAIVLACTNVAGAAPEREVDPRFLTRTEVRLLQDALIWTGHYAQVKDGVWTRETADAARGWRQSRQLRQSDTFTKDEIARLFQQALREQQDAGWITLQEPNTRVWMGYPTRFTSPSAPIRTAAGSVLALFTGAINMAVLRETTGLSDARQLFANADQAEGVARVLYRLDRDDRQVLWLERKDGWASYNRFDRIGGEWIGFQLEIPSNRPDASFVVVVVSADFSATTPPVGLTASLTLANAPVLGPILEEIRTSGSGATTPLPAVVAPPTAPLPPIASAPAQPPPTPASASPQRAEKLSGTGTAFAVRKDGTLLTNQHVVDGCTRLALADGTPVNLVRADKGRDLAIIRANNMMPPEVVRFRRDTSVELGEAVNLYGYPLYGAVTTSLNLTNGTVTALTGLRDTAMHFQISAPMQPGNSGGPVVDGSGLLVGVAVARISDRFIAEATGAVPQVMNYAIRATVAEAFLLENGILVEKAAPGWSFWSSDQREVARQMQAALRPLLCYQ